MFRLVLASYLMLTTALGPWLCCCGAAQTASWSLGESSSPATPKRSLHGCCGRHSSAPERHAPRKQGPAGVPTQPPVDPCPCHNQDTIVVSSLQAKGAGTLIRPSASLDVFGYASLLPFSFGFSLSHSGDSPSEQSAHTFHDTRHRLSALQTLRC